MWTRTHLFPKKEAEAFSLALFFLILGFFLTFAFPLKTNAEIENPTPTIHAKESGGYWHNPNTWVEGRVPNEEDTVELNGNISVYGQHHIQNLLVRRGTQISPQRGSSKLIVNETYLQETESQNDVITEVSGDIINRGEIKRNLVIKGASHIQNEGIIHSIIFNTESPITLENTGSIEYIELRHDLIINTGFTTSYLRMNTFSIFLTEETENTQFFVGKISGSASNHPNEIDGKVTLTTNRKAIEVRKLKVENLHIPENYSLSIQCKVEIDGNLILHKRSTLSIGGEYCMKKLIVDGNLILEQEANIYSYYGSLEVKKKLINNGEIKASTEVYGGIDNDGNIYKRMTGSNVFEKKVIIVENEEHKAIHISGLEEYEVAIEGIVKIDSPQQLIVKRMNAYTPSSILFSHPENATLILRNGARYNSHISTNVPIRVTEGGSLDGEIYAPRITVENGLSFFRTRAHIHAPFIVEHGSVSGDGGPEHSRTYFHDDVILKEGTHFLLSLYSDAAYFYKNIESHTDNTSQCYHCHNPTSYLTNEYENDAPYTFEIQYHGQTLSLPTDDFSITSFHYVSENGEEKFKEIRDVIFSPQDTLRWRSKSASSDWSPWYTINEKLYLEENNHFFTTSVNDVTEGEAQEIVIRAEDNEFSGDVQLSVDEGSVSPSVVHMENGEVTVSVAFDTPQEYATLSIQSVEHPLLTGSSPPFNVLHAIRAHFFTMPPVTEARVGEVLSIPLSAEETEYEGDVEITFHNGNGGKELLSPLFHMKDGKVTFWYELRREAENAFFSFRDVERDYLRGESIPFRILLKKKKRNRGGTRRTNPRVETHIVSEIFITQGEVEQEDEQSEQEEAAPPQENNEGENGDANGGNEESGNEEEQDEPHYLLENTCLDIHSELPVLKKGTSDHENTKKLQDFLIAKHYLTPPPDGIFGNNTKTALKDFQQDHNLTPDGIFGQGSSHFIDVHCGSIPMREELREDNEEDAQQENQDDEVGEEQDEQTNDNTHNDDEEPTLWSEVWDEISGWFAGLFGGGGDSESEDESGVSGGDGEEEEEEEDIHQYVTREMLQNAFNLNVDNEIVYEINRNFPLYNILTKERQAHFLSQVAHESGLRVVAENWKYSKIQLLKTFGCRSKKINGKWIKQWDYRRNTCKGGYKKYVNSLWKNPEHYVYSKNLFNHVYANRMGNGDEASGDGFRYRGRGLIQLTGKDNYRGFTYDWNEKNHSDQRNFVQNPDLLLQKKYGTASAFFFWRVKNINSVANGSDENSIRNVTLKVNGGFNGIKDRIKKFNSIYEVLIKN